MESDPSILSRSQPHPLFYLPPELYVALSEFLDPVSQKVLARTCSTFRTLFIDLIWAKKPGPQLTRLQRFDMLHLLARDHLYQDVCPRQLRFREITRFPVMHPPDGLTCYHVDEPGTRDFCLHNANSQTAFKWIRRYKELGRGHQDALQDWLKDLYEVDNTDRKAWWWRSPYPLSNSTLPTSVLIHPGIFREQLPGQRSEPQTIVEKDDNSALKHLAKVSWTFADGDSLFHFRICEHIHYLKIDEAREYYPRGFTPIWSRDATLDDLVSSSRGRDTEVRMSCEVCRTDFALEVFPRGFMEITAWYELASEFDLLSFSATEPALLTWLREGLGPHSREEPSGNRPLRPPGCVRRLYERGQRVILPRRV